MTHLLKQQTATFDLTTPIQENLYNESSVEGNHNSVNVRPSVDKHHPTVVTWADVVREK